MSLGLFHKVPTEAIDMLFDEQKQGWFRKVLGIENIKHNFKDFPSHYVRPRFDHPIAKEKNPYDIFIDLDSSIEMAVRSKKPKAVALVKWLTKKGIEKIQEEHQQATTDCDNQIQALEFPKKEEYQALQQEILRLDEEINDLIANRHVARRGCFDNVLCFIKKNSGEVHPYYIFRCQHMQLGKRKWWLRIRYPNMEVANKYDDPNAIHR